MGKKKRKRRFKARTIWAMVLAYFIVGGVVATLFLQGMTSGADPGGAGQPSLSNAWALFPLVAMLWPAFLLWMLVRAFL